MGWNASAEPSAEALPNSRKIKLTVKFTSDTIVRGDLLENQLNSAGVDAPTRAMPSVEDEQGPGVLLRKDGLFHAVCVALGVNQGGIGRATEDAWGLGYAIGESCRVMLVFGECSYRFGDSSFKAEVPPYSTHGVRDIFCEIDMDLERYASMSNKLLCAPNPRHCEKARIQLKNIFNKNSAELFKKSQESNVVDENLRLVVAFFMGLIYGKLKALLVATGLEGSEHLEFRDGWMDFLPQFLYDVHAKMWDLSSSNMAKPSMHAVFSFISMCCSSQSTFWTPGA